MTISATPALVHYSPNHGARRTQTLGVILHSTRSGRSGREAEYQRTIGYMMQPSTVSAHRVIGVVESQHAQMVEDDVIAWHAASDNKYWLGIEFCQPRPEDEYSDWQVATGIAVVVAWCRQYALIPSERTIRLHQETEQGRLAGKSDPGDKFPTAYFRAEVRRRLGH